MPEEFIANDVPKEHSGNRFSRDVAFEARNIARNKAYSAAKRSAPAASRRGERVAMLPKGNTVTQVVNMRSDRAVVSRCLAASGRLPIG